MEPTQAHCLKEGLVPDMVLGMPEVSSSLSCRTWGEAVSDATRQTTRVRQAQESMLLHAGPWHVQAGRQA